MNEPTTVRRTTNYYKTMGRHKAAGAYSVHFFDDADPVSEGRALADARRSAKELGANPLSAISVYRRTAATSMTAQTIGECPGQDPD